MPAPKTDWYEDPKYTRQRPRRISRFWTGLALLIIVAECAFWLWRLLK